MSNTPTSRKLIDEQINFLVARIHYNYTLYGLEYLDRYIEGFTEILALMRLRGDIPMFP